ncbi:MBL fold metallo-hydrolase [Celeribacter litoreus]|uniref:MBL fold metallo-hydrolase n=1 Tax=Celeribacter litoreus TaxID=2876714 RepID=UPI001CCEDF36|nr:MBL fold metallo-hydrolase [Celeribacter litoreus]MCA0042534.1 MBL fold metallo-hydrolase [Celeribacter litoreus]
MTDQINFGSFSVTRINDLPRFALDLDFLLPGATLEALMPFKAVLDGDHVDFATSEILLGVHSLLIRDKGFVALIDTCVGECKPRGRRADWHNRRASGYLEALAREGLRPEDINLVMCTHLHADHVGWNTCLQNGEWVPTFPNARYIMGREELAHWAAEEQAAPGVANHGAYADSVLPIVAAGLADLVSAGDTVADQFHVCGLPGHSVGQIGLEMSSSKGDILFCGDAIHSPVQTFFPDWSSRFCHDPALSTKTRRDLMTSAADKGTLLIPAHFRGALGMRVTSRDDHFIPEFI